MKAVDRHVIGCTGPKQGLNVVKALQDTRLYPYALRSGYAGSTAPFPRHVLVGIGQCLAPIVLPERMRLYVRARVSTG
jgi:hypothetical protein